MVHRPMAKEKTMRSSHKGQALMGKKLTSKDQLWRYGASAEALPQANRVF